MLVQSEGARRQYLVALTNENHARLDGRYDDAYLKSAGKDAPKFTDNDMKIIAAPVDFVGINVISRRCW